MHLTHKAGEKTFIDFSGKTVDIINPKNGVATKAELFIAVLPASGFAFIKAIASQKKRDFTVNFGKLKPLLQSQHKPASA